MPSGKDEAGGMEFPAGLCQIQHLRNIGQVIQGKAYAFRLPLFYNPEEIGMPEYLQIQQPHLMPGFARGFGDKLQTQGLQAKINLRVHQGTGVYKQDLHDEGSSAPNHPRPDGLDSNEYLFGDNNSG